MPSFVKILTLTYKIHNVSCYIIVPQLRCHFSVDKVNSWMDNFEQYIEFSNELDRRRVPCLALKVKLSGEN